MVEYKTKYKECIIMIWKTIFKLEYEEGAELIGFASLFLFQGCLDKWKKGG